MNIENRKNNKTGLTEEEKEVKRKILTAKLSPNPTYKVVNCILWRKESMIIKFDHHQKCTNCTYFLGVPKGKFVWTCTKCRKNHIVCFDCSNNLERFTVDDNDDLWYTWSCTAAALKKNQHI